MTDSPFYTILTASLNNGSTIRKNLQSVREQSFEDLEHFVIDGGSNDETLSVLKEFENTYRLKWISESDAGISDALNKGLGKTVGRYILVLQADDRLLSPGILESVYPLLKDESVDIWSFPVILDDPHKGKKVRKPIRHLWWNHLKFIFLHQGSFVNRRVFEKIGDFRKEFRINLDYDFFYRALGSHCSVEFGKAPIALMGGGGIGSDLRYISMRLEEERLVQDLNEQNPFWRLSQRLFRFFYGPYKNLFIRRQKSFLEKLGPDIKDG